MARVRKERRLWQRKSGGVKERWPLPRGEELPLVGETDRFWVCENTRFRKCSPLVAAVTKTRRKKEEESDAHSE